MKRLKRLISRTTAWARTKRDEERLRAEIEAHIAFQTEDNIRAGLSPDEARRQAVLKFGPVEGIKESYRDQRGLPFAENLLRDARYALRRFRKSPAFTATALLTLALCLGANLTIFAVVEAILLRPLPFPHPDRLVTIFNTYPKAGVERDGASITNYYERRGRIPAFTSLSIYAFGAAIVGENGTAEREPVTRVSPDFFTTLGVGPVIGRSFTNAEMTYQTDDVAILTNACWRQQFGSDPHVIGRKIWVDTFPKTVVGVLPPGLRFLSTGSQLYLPLSSSSEQRAPQNRHSGGNVIQMIARLEPGATLAQAQSEIDAQNAALEKTDPQAKLMSDAGFRSLVVPLHADQVAAIRPVLLLLQAGVLLLLLIGAVNLVNLFLIRANVRVKETAVRQALGASRQNIAFDVVVEAMLLCLPGGLLGLAVGAGGIRLVAALGADRLPFGAHIALDVRVAAAGVVGAVVLGVLLAAPIAWFNLRLPMANALQFGIRGATAGRAAQRLRHGFIVAQIALGFVLLAGTGLLALSLKHATDVSPGFEPDHVITGQVALVGNKYPSPVAGLAFNQRLVSELGHQPGVLAVGMANNIPFSGNNGKSAATVKGYVLPPGESVRANYSYGVDGDYFRAMGLSLLAGRFLTSADSRRGLRTCVVDEDFARHYWPRSSAIGRLLFQGSGPGPDSEAFRVVGVVRSVKQAGLTDEAAQGAVYYPYIYRPDNKLFIVVRGSIRPQSLALALQSVVRRIDPELVVSGIQPMDERIASSLMARRSPALLAGIFSAVALLLIAIGTYGVLSYAVAQRRREIAVRIALGARPDQIRSQFFSLALRLLAGGIALGLFGAWLAGEVMQAVLFHVPAHNPAILAASASIVAVVALAACLLPAQRAARISPVQALADEP